MESTVTDSVLKSEPKPEITAVYEVLNNELLLDRIFEKMDDPSMDLRILRLVCKKWKRRATVCLREKYWMSRTFLVLTNTEKLKKYTHTLAPSIPSEPESQFLHHGRLALESEDSISLEEESQLFQCYKINLLPGCILTGRMKNLNKVKINTEIPVIFFGVFLQSVKSLDLSMQIDVGKSESVVLDKILASQSSSLSEFRLSTLVHADDIRVSLTDEEKTELNGCQYEYDGIKLVNLDYLCIDIGIYAESEHLPKEGLPDWMERLLDNILKKIPANRPVQICLLNWKYIQRLIRVLNKYEQVKNLKVLDFHYDQIHDAEDLKSLGECGVRLQSLAVRANVHLHELKLTYPQGVYDFLSSQLHSLEVLSLESTKRFKFHWKPMVALKKLKLRCLFDPEENELELPHDAEWNANCRPMFYDLFPNLEELYIDVFYGLESVDEFYSWFLPPQLPCTSVKKLEIDYFSGLNTGILTAISTTFTHLKSLIIGGFSLETKIEEENFFHTLWNAQFALGLEELSIQLTNCKEQRDVGGTWDKYRLDNLFSGVDEEIIKNMSESGNYSSFPSSNNSILNFKSLRTLIIIDYFDVVNKQGIFTDFSAFCVFGKLERLRCLRLSKGMWEFSKNASAYLQRKLQDASTLLNYPFNQKHLERYLYKEPFPGLCLSRMRNLDEITINLTDLDLNKDKGDGY